MYQELQIQEDFRIYQNTFYMPSVFYLLISSDIAEKMGSDFHLSYKAGLSTKFFLGNWIYLVLNKIFLG